MSARNLPNYCCRKLRGTSWEHVPEDVFAQKYHQYLEPLPKTSILPMPVYYTEPVEVPAQNLYNTFNCELCSSKWLDWLYLYLA